jgi:hypothetical protein
VLQTEANLTGFLKMMITIFCELQMQSRDYHYKIYTFEKTHVFDSTTGVDLGASLCVRLPLFYSEILFTTTPCSNFPAMLRNIGKHLGHLRLRIPHLYVRPNIVILIIQPIQKLHLILCLSLLHTRMSIATLLNCRSAVRI